MAKSNRQSAQEIAGDVAEALLSQRRSADGTLRMQPTEALALAQVYATLALVDAVYDLAKRIGGA